MNEEEEKQMSNKRSLIVTYNSTQKRLEQSLSQKYCQIEDLNDEKIRAYKEEINKWTLQFQDETIQKEYEKIDSKSIQYNYYLLTLYLTITLIAMSICFLWKQGLSLLSIFGLYQILVNILTLSFSLFSNRQKQFYIIFIQINFIYTFIEMILLLDNTQSLDLKFHLVSILFLFVNLQMLNLYQQFISQIVISVGLTIYILARTQQNPTKNYKNIFQINIQHQEVFYPFVIFSWLYYLTAEYFKQLFSKLNFLNLYTKFIDASNYKYLIEKALPIPMILLQPEQRNFGLISATDRYKDKSPLKRRTESYKISMINNYMKKEFKAISINEANKRLNEIFILKSDPGNLEASALPVQLGEHIKEYDFIEEIEDSMSQKKKFHPKLVDQFFNCQWCREPPKLSERILKDFSLLKDSSCFYDIQIFKCLWENKESMMILFTNISQKKQAVMNKELDLYKDDMLSTVSHDLQTPLNGILFMLESASRCQDLEEVQQKIALSKNNGTLLQCMVNDIIDYSKITKENRLSLNPQQFLIQALFEEVQNLFDIEIRKQKTTFEFIFEPPYDQRTFIYNDYDRILQILINLVGNAIQFTPSGYVRLICHKDIVTVGDEKRKKSVSFSVRDSGIGIAPSMVPDLFQIFGTRQFQQKSKSHGNKKFYSTGTKLIMYFFQFQGVGLGLTFCQLLVQHLGPYDQLQLDSQENQGSTFTFSVFESLEEGKMEQINLPHIDRHQGSIVKSTNTLSELEVLRKGSIEVLQNYSLQPHIDNESFQLFSQQKQQNFFQMDEQVKGDNLFLNGNYNRTTDLNNLVDQMEDSNPSIARQYEHAHNQIGRVNDLIEKMTYPEVQSGFYQVTGAIQDAKPENPYFTNIKNILIVDDVAMNVEVLKELLRPYEQQKFIRVDECFDGDEALQKVYAANENEVPYDLILMDVNMPRMDGLQATRQIREMISRSIIKHCYILIISAFDDQNDIERGIKAGADMYLKKPVDEDQLIYYINLLDQNIPLNPLEENVISRNDKNKLTFMLTK